MYRNFFPLFDFQRTKTQKMEIPDKKSCQPRVIEKLHIFFSKMVLVVMDHHLNCILEEEH